MNSFCFLSAARNSMSSLKQIKPPNRPIPQVGDIVESRIRKQSDMLWCRFIVLEVRPSITYTADAYDLKVLILWHFDDRHNHVHVENSYLCTFLDEEGNEEPLTWAQREHKHIIVQRCS
jgi:hypothetical protein